jgi:hypothetical protein
VKASQDAFKGKAKKKKPARARKTK